MYGVQVVTNKGEKKDVKVDAKTGKVLKAEADDNENESENSDEQE